MVELPPYFTMTQPGFELQLTLSNDYVSIRPLEEEDFEQLYAVASDPAIWEQHPNPDRYKRDIFKNFFKGAMESHGAFLVIDSKTQKIIGSTRYYGFNPETGSVYIGYTFLAKEHWGGSYNTALKILMLGHAFKFVDKVEFHIGASNIRSQKAIERLGAKKIAELVVKYYGETEKLNFVYQLCRT